MNFEKVYGLLFTSLLLTTLTTGCLYFPKESHKITRVTIDSGNVLEIEIESWSKKIQRSYGHSFDYLEDEKLSLWINGKEVQIRRRMWINDTNYYGWYKIPYSNYIINASENYHHLYADVPFTQTAHNLTIFIRLENSSIDLPIKAELKKDGKVVDTYLLEDHQKGGS